MVVPPCSARSTSFIAVHRHRLEQCFFLSLAVATVVTCLFPRMVNSMVNSMVNNMFFSHSLLPPVCSPRMVNNMGGVNRVRSCPQQPGMVAVWSDNAQVRG